MNNPRPVTRPARATWSESQPARNQTRLALALGLSLALHAILFSLRFGAAGFGWPGIALPWAERRVQASNLIVRLADVPGAPGPLTVLPPAAPESISIVRRPRTDKPIHPIPPGTRTQLRRRAKPSVSLPRIEAPRVAQAAPRRDRQRAVLRQPQPEILAQAEPRQETFAVAPPVPAEPAQQQAPEVAATKQAEESSAPVKEPEPEVQKLADDETARQRAEEAVARERVEETARQQAEEAAARQRAEEVARQRALALQKELEERRQEEVRKLEEAKKLEERRQDEVKKLEEARRLEELKRLEDAVRQEQAKAARIALELEALKRAEEAAAKQRAAEAARQRELEAKRQAEAAAARAQELAERQRAEALAAAQLPSRAAAGTIGDGKPAVPSAAPSAPSGREMAAKALEQLRKPGAARTEPDFPRAPARSADSTRRRSILGGAEQDVGLRMYVDSWRWKVERYGTLNYPPSAWGKATENPVVTVAIRSDGSLEEVFIHRSSGLRELDEAVRRIVRLYAPYGVFPPDLARRYDVIEIRRVWFFGETLRILEEM